MPAPLRNVGTPDTMQPSWPELASSRRYFLPLLGGEGRGEGGRFGPPYFHKQPAPRRGVRSPEAGRLFYFAAPVPRWLRSQASTSATSDGLSPSANDGINDVARRRTPITSLRSNTCSTPSDCRRV